MERLYRAKRNYKKLWHKQKPFQSRLEDSMTYFFEIKRKNQEKGDRFSFFDFCYAIVLSSITHQSNKAGAWFERSSFRITVMPSTNGTCGKWKMAHIFSYLCVVLLFLWYVRLKSSKYSAYRSLSYVHIYEWLDFTVINVQLNAIENMHEEVVREIGGDVNKQKYRCIDSQRSRLCWWDGELEYKQYTNNNNNNQQLEYVPSRNFLSTMLLSTVPWDGKGQYYPETIDYRDTLLYSVDWQSFSSPLNHVCFCRSHCVVVRCNFTQIAFDKCVSLVSSTSIYVCAFS